jgi:hypothetical protein
MRSVVVALEALNLSARVLVAVVVVLEEALSARSRSAVRDIVEVLRVTLDTLDRELVGEAAAR